MQVDKHFPLEPPVNKLIKNFVGGNQTKWSHFIKNSFDRTFTVAFLPMYACYCTPRKTELDLTFHRGLLLFTLQDKRAVCSSCVAQWEVRPEAGCRWGACSHTRLPPLGCLSTFQPLSFLMLKMHLSSCGLEKVKYKWQATVNSRATDTNTHSCVRR